MKKHSYIGLDVHKESVSSAVAEAGRNGEVREHGTVGGSLIGLERALGKLRSREWNSIASTRRARAGSSFTGA